MFSAKKDHLIGLDIGSRTIKLAEILQTKKDRILKKFGIADLPQGAIVDGRIKEPGVVADTIKGLMNDLKVKEQKVAISIAGYSIIIKRITVDKMTDDEMQEGIQYEAEQYIPFELQDVNIDFHIIGNHESNPNQMNVMLVAAKKEIVDEYVDLLEMANLKPCVIDIDVFALERMFEDNYLNEEGNIALIDIGANKMNMNIVKDNISVFTRDVSVGGDQITREIASRFDCSFEEAEAAKIGEAKNKVPEEGIQEIISSFTSIWCDEIRRGIDFYCSTYRDEDIRQIILSGGATQTPGFFDLLSAETSVDVQMCKPFESLQIDEKQNDLDYLHKIAPQAAICMGLASRRVYDK
ncbi:MAG: pilus assembly protein PilM [Desulfobacterales bacterium C00003060]|nr:MAG: pilus assembly protein PilM [Desulfobacterales bacterium S3730MH5]OEU79179.1 MAG: pilus assembly protein PilM [Desulfobacterales bacterium C00003060]